jgi:hypothetical protein
MPENDVNEDKKAMIEDIREILKQLSSAIAANSKQLSAIALSSKDTATSVNGLGPCRFPWRNFTRMCLLLNQERTVWNEAEAFCNQKGGFLLWLENESEHKTVIKFLKYDGEPLVYKYHIGLHRLKEGERLQWSSGSVSSYRGFGRYRQDRKTLQFFAYGDDGDFTGMTFANIATKPFVCRRP